MPRPRKFDKHRIGGIPGRLQTAMVHGGWNFRTLAEIVGCSQQYLSQIHRGTRSGRRLMPKLAAALDVSAEWLSTGRNPPPVARSADDEGRELLNALVMLRDSGLTGAASDVIRRAVDPADAAYRRHRQHAGELTNKARGWAFSPTSLHTILIREALELAAASDRWRDTPARFLALRISAMLTRGLDKQGFDDEAPGQLLEAALTRPGTSGNA